MTVAVLSEIDQSNVLAADCWTQFHCASMRTQVIPAFFMRWISVCCCWAESTEAKYP